MAEASLRTAGRTECECLVGDFVEQEIDTLAQAGHLVDLFQPKCQRSNKSSVAAAHRFERGERQSDEKEINESVSLTSGRAFP